MRSPEGLLFLFVKNLIKKLNDFFVFLGHFFYFCLLLEKKTPEMLKELDNHFLALEKKISNLQKEYLKLKESLAELHQEHEELKLKYDDERSRNQVLAEEQKKIKLHAAISGNPEHNRLMKNHINRLIKQVDTCIAQLQNSGL